MRALYLSVEGEVGFAVLVRADVNRMAWQQK
jgi:hypothetical protein